MATEQALRNLSLMREKLDLMKAQSGCGEVHLGCVRCEPEASLSEPEWELVVRNYLGRRPGRHDIYSVLMGGLSGPLKVVPNPGEVGERVTCRSTVVVRGPRHDALRRVVDWLDEFYPLVTDGLTPPGLDTSSVETFEGFVEALVETTPLPHDPSALPRARLLKDVPVIPAILDAAEPGTSVRYVEAPALVVFTTVVRRLFGKSEERIELLNEAERLEEEFGLSTRPTEEQTAFVTAVRRKAGHPVSFAKIKETFPLVVFQGNQSRIYKKLPAPLKERIASDEVGYMWGEPEST